MLSDESDEKEKKREERSKEIIKRYFILQAKAHPHHSAS